MEPLLFMTLSILWVVSKDLIGLGFCTRVKVVEMNQYINPDVKLGGTRSLTLQLLVNTSSKLQDDQGSAYRFGVGGPLGRDVSSVILRSWLRLLPDCLQHVRNVRCLRCLWQPLSLRLNAL